MSLAERNRIREIRNELLLALDYEETGDIAKARQVITLVNQLLLMRPDSASHAGSSVSFSPESLREMKSDARLWVKMQERATSSGTVYHQPSCDYRG